MLSWYLISSQSLSLLLWHWCPSFLNQLFTFSMNSKYLQLPTVYISFKKWETIFTKFQFLISFQSDSLRSAYIDFLSSCCRRHDAERANATSRRHNSRLIKFHRSSGMFSAFSEKPHSISPFLKQQAEKRETNTFKLYWFCFLSCKWRMILKGPKNVEGWRKKHTAHDERQ